MRVDTSFILHFFIFRDSDFENEKGIARRVRQAKVVASRLRRVRAAYNAFGAFQLASMAHEMSPTARNQQVLETATQHYREIMQL